MHLVHSLLKSGWHTHVEFTRAAWEAALCDPDTVSRWTHDEKDCHDPAARLWARLRQEGHFLHPRQHELADMEDPAWVGNREERREQVEIVQFVPEADKWPPDLPLPVWHLAEMAGICHSDARDILFPHLRPTLPDDLHPMDKDGNWTLF